MINNLLQLKNGLKKYGRNIKTIQSLHDANEQLLKWHKSYEKGDLEKEEENYTYFASTILTGVLGYHDQEDFKHEVKLKRKSVDFLILKNGEPYIVIELKGSNTVLDKKYNKRPSAVNQAFDYGGEKKSVEWIVVSNYCEFRLYHKSTKENMISFDLDELIYHNGDKDILKLFLLVFSRESVVDHDNLTKLYDKDRIIIERENITKNFYKLYHNTRILIVEQLLGKGLGKDTTINYANTILNRIIFVCFCEDMGLLPANSVYDEILKPVKSGRLSGNKIWQGLNELWMDVDKGNPHIEIPQYNGGLFKEDLNRLNLNDEIENKDINISYGFTEKEEKIDQQIKSFPYLNPVYRNLLIISSFNYGSELNVNILGHIFEQSINDIETLKEDETISERKKHGIYYTPEVITEYICENTIIPYLSKKKDNNDHTVKKLIEEYEGNIGELEDKLKNIRICDPACGSGAFLNKAVDVLLSIHIAIHVYKYEDNDNGLKPFFDDVNQRKNILLDNIYGVDLNKESVEITKLSLFLKVAQSENKLPDLDKNIRCGNSLISDLDYTDKPFDWEKEFKEVIGGGFDVVIGNPPYVRQEQIKEFKPYFEKRYNSYIGTADLYVYFYELGLKILREDGYLGFISSNKFTRANYGKKLREFLSRYNITNYNDYTGEKVFESVTVDSSVIIVNKNTSQEDILVNDDFKMDQNGLNDGSWSLNIRRF
ncbi:MAG: Eco57I restriction-modification methylase domain-containing protein [Methanobrevibacter sp.]|jgi:hypothetical protein|nr:Eco57I restriction-modification methylase domain-containing protein [Candidatus Methanovirga aequatorialis]